MSADPRGRWFRVYARQVRQHPKFRDLTGLELGAWTALRSEAELRDCAILADRADALMILRRRHVSKPAVVLDRLVGLALFDVLDDGAIAVHDREDHDRPKYPSDDPEKVKERVDKHRQSKGTEPGNDDETTRVTSAETSGNDDETIAPVRAPESGAGAASVSLSDKEGVQGEEVPDGWDAPDAVVAYHDVTGRYPSEKVIEWLNRLGNDHPEEAIARVLAEQYASDASLQTLLSRTDAALKLDAHRRSKAEERARARAQSAAEAPHRQTERIATPEQREQAAWQREAIRIALAKKLIAPTDVGEVRAFVQKYAPSFKPQRAAA